MNDKEIIVEMRQALEAIAGGVRAGKIPNVALVVGDNQALISLRTILANALAAAKESEGTIEDGAPVLGVRG
jgi:hypothetical protein